MTPRGRSRTHDRLLGFGVVVVLIAVGTFLGSAIAQRDAAPRVGAVSGPDEGGAPGGVRQNLASRWERVRVEVLNGGGRSGMAASATDRLREDGFDVVYFGNASSFDREASVVIDRVGRPEMAEAVAVALGVTRVLSEPDSTLYVDVSVVLGEEWEPEVAPEPVPAPRRPWWDPRGWFDSDGGGVAPGPIGPVKSADPDRSGGTTERPDG